MKWSERRVGLLVLMAAAFATLLGASAPQQPLVVRNAAPQGAVPADCDKSLSDVPQTARLDVARIPMPNVSTVALAPPSRELRAEIEDLHRALTRNDRPAFDEHLAAARQIVAGYPSGAEKRGAEDLLRVYTDTAHLWDAQFASPFFDESSAEYDILKNYPGYAEAVRRGMLTDDRDHRFYPAAESRAFLTRVAADRLARLGIAAPRVARAGDEKRAVSRPETKPTRATSTESRSTSKAPVIASTKPRSTSTKAPSASPKTTPSRPTTPHRTATRSTPSQTPERTPVSSTPVTRTPTRVASETRPPVTSPATTHKPAPAPVPVATTTQPAAPPPLTATSASTTTPITTTRTETSVVPPSDSTTMPPTETAIASTSSEPAPVTPPAPRRSMILPVILILVGLGVLILLFRAST